MRLVVGVEFAVIEFVFTRKKLTKQGRQNAKLNERREREGFIEEIKQ